MSSLCLKEKGVFVEADSCGREKVFKLACGSGEYALNSAFRPYEKALDRVERAGALNSRLGVLLGMGSGYEYEAMLEKFPEDAKIFVYEPDRDFFYSVVSERNLFLKLEDRRASFFLGDSAEEILSAIEKLGSDISFRNPVIIEAPAYSRVYEEKIKNFYTKFSELLEIEKAVITTKKVGEKVFTSNIMENLPSISSCADISELKGVFKGSPAVVVSAGPSLKKQLSKLKTIKGKAFIICVDTALRELIKEGVKPDIVVSIDFTPVNYKHFNGIDTGGYVYLFASTVYPQCLKHHISCGGEYFSLLNDSPLSDWLMNFWGVRGFIPIGDSTSHAAFHLAEYCGCENIALIGQDLAYTGGCTHSPGVATFRKAESKDNLSIEGYYGDRVETSTALFTILKNFEKKIKRSASSVFNCTEGGAKIGNAKQLPFSQFIETFCVKKTDFEPKIKELCRNKNYFDVESFRDSYKSINYRMGRLARLSVRGIKIIRKALNSLCEGSLEDFKKSVLAFDSIYEEIMADNFCLKLVQADIETSIISLRWEEKGGNLRVQTLEELQKDMVFMESLLSAVLSFRKKFREAVIEMSDRKNALSLASFVIKKISSKFGGLK